MFFRKKNKESNEILELEKEAVIETSENEVNTDEVNNPIITEETVISNEQVIADEHTTPDTNDNLEEIAIEDIQEDILDEIDTLEEEVPEEDFANDIQDKPIYILGENSLAVYLAVKFINSGEKVVVIPSKEKASTFSNNGITMIENHSLQKSHQKFNTTFWLKDTPKMLIITSEANKINASITAISRKKLVNIPVVLFTPIRDITYIKNILENEIYRAFFDGYLLNKSNQVNLYGRAPNITICTKGKHKKDRRIIETFQNAGLNTEAIENEANVFWEFFTVYTTCSLISAAYNKNIFDVIKDKDKRDKMIPLISELCKIAKKDGAIIDQEELLKRIYNTPLSYPYPLQVELSQGKAGDIDLISSNVVNLARKYKVKIPELNALLKRIYNIILA